MTVELESLGALDWLVTLSRARVALLGDGDRVLKYFGPLTASESAHLDRLRVLRLGLAQRHRDLLDEHCCWPTELVADDGFVVGYLMRATAARSLAFSGPTTVADARSLIAVVRSLAAVGVSVEGDPRWDWGIEGSVLFWSCDEWPTEHGPSPFAWQPDSRLDLIAPRRPGATLGLGLRLVLGEDLANLAAVDRRVNGHRLAELYAILADPTKDAPGPEAWAEAIGGVELTAQQLIELATTGDFAAVAMASTLPGERSSIIESLKQISLRHVAAENPIRDVEATRVRGGITLEWLWPASDLITGALVGVGSREQSNRTPAEVAVARTSATGFAEVPLHDAGQGDLPVVTVSTAASVTGSAPSSWTFGPPIAVQVRDTRSNT